MPIKLDIWHALWHGMLFQENSYQFLIITV